MILWTGFIFGLLNSLHCLGMCGPIALSLPVPEQSNRGFAVMLYNLGRIATYSLMGLVFGSVGEVIAIFGFQQYLSIACGIAMLLFVGLPFVGIYPDRYLGRFSIMSAKLKSYFNSLFKQRSLTALFFIGTLNGLLPCGIVYLALAGAASMGNAGYGALYMGIFGLGTAPIMGFVAYYKNKQNLTGINLTKLIPVFTITTAVLLILRGMNLGIPYVSPTLTEHKVSCCSPQVKCH